MMSVAVSEKFLFSYTCLTNNMPSDAHDYMPSDIHDLLICEFCLSM